MICVSGAVEVICEDGSKKNTFALDRRNQALLVPPGLWNTVEFRQDGSVLIVLCDRVYEADDYIRDYAEFLSFRESVRRMKIVVTGALGHIGSALIRALPNRFAGAEIVMIDNMATLRYPSLFDLPAREGTASLKLTCAMPICAPCSKTRMRRSTSPQRPMLRAA